MAQERSPTNEEIGAEDDAAQATSGWETGAVEEEAEEETDRSLGP